MNDYTPEQYEEVFKATKLKREVWDQLPDTVRSAFAHVYFG